MAGVFQVSPSDSTDGKVGLSREGEGERVPVGGDDAGGGGGGGGGGAEGGYDVAAGEGERVGEDDASAGAPVSERTRLLIHDAAQTLRIERLRLLEEGEGAGAGLFGGGTAGAGGYDAARTLRMGLFGLALYGPLSGAWYGALDHWVGRCRLTASNPELKARLVSALETKL